MTLEEAVAEQGKTLIQIERDIWWGRWILLVVVTVLIGVIWMGYDLAATTAASQAGTQAQIEVLNEKMAVLAEQMTKLAEGQEELRQDLNEVKVELRLLAKRLESEHALYVQPE